MENTITYHQGKAFPPTAQGVGIFLMFMAALPTYLAWSEIGWLIILTGGIFALGAWFVFAKTVLHCQKGNADSVEKIVGFLIFKFKFKIKLSDYDAAVIRQMNIKYNVKQGVGPDMVLTTGVHRESFVGLNLKYKGKYEFHTIFKGTEKEVFQFVQNHLLRSGLYFFRGAIKKGLEIVFKDQDSLQEMMAIGEE